MYRLQIYILDFFVSGARVKACHSLDLLSARLPTSEGGGSGWRMTLSHLERSLGEV